MRQWEKVVSNKNNKRLIHKRWVKLWQKASWQRYEFAERWVTEQLWLFHLSHQLTKVNQKKWPPIIISHHMSHHTSLNSYLEVDTILTAAITSTVLPVQPLCNSCSTIFIPFLWNKKTSITPSIFLSPLPVQRIHYNGTRVSHFSLDEGFACLWSLFQPSHTDGFLGPVICPVQVVSHPVHSYSLYCVYSWDKHILLVRSLLLQHTCKHY